MKLEEIEAAELGGYHAEDEDDNLKAGPKHAYNVDIPLKNTNGRLRKRRKDETSESPQKGSPKRVRLAQDGESHTISVSATDSLPASEFSPTPKPVTSLLRPNPMNLARPHWVTQARRGLRGKPTDVWSLDDLSSRRSSRLGRTLQTADFEATEEGSQRVEEVVEEREWRTVFPELQSTAVGALTPKPAPGTLAKRRWSTGFWDSQPSSPVESGASDDEDNDKDGETVDTEIDFKKRFSVYYNNPTFLNNSSDDEVSSTPSRRERN